jgi:DNA-binding transcriptional ArsR family regulator
VAAYVRSVLSYHYVPLYAAGLVERKDVDAREATLLKKVLGIAMSANHNVVRNIYETNYTSIGDQVAEAGTKLRLVTRALKEFVSKSEEHQLYQELIIGEQTLEMLDPKAYKQWMSEKLQAKKDYTKTRASVTILPLNQRLMLNSAQGRIHPHGYYKCYECVECTVLEKDLPTHWQTCPAFARELANGSILKPAHYVASLNQPNNNILTRPKSEQIELHRHYSAIAAAITQLEERGEWVSRDYIYSTVKAKKRNEPQLMESR